MYILLQNNHHRQNYLQRQANATISPPTKKTEEMGTLTMLSLAACNIYVREVHRAQRRTIFQGTPREWPEAHTNKSTSGSVFALKTSQDIDDQQWQTNTKQMYKKSHIKHSHRKLVQSLSSSVESTKKTMALGSWESSCGPEVLLSIVPATNRAQKRRPFTIMTVHTVVAWPCGKTGHPFAAAPATTEREVVMYSHLWCTRTIRLTRRLQEHHFLRPHVFKLRRSAIDPTAYMYKIGSQ